jgi:hypothetical protein
MHAALRQQLVLGLHRRHARSSKPRGDMNTGTCFATKWATVTDGAQITGAQDLPIDGFRCTKLVLMFLVRSPGHGQCLNLRARGLSSSGAAPA